MFYKYCIFLITYVKCTLVWDTIFYGSYNVCFEMCIFNIGYRYRYRFKHKEVGVWARGRTGQAPLVLSPQHQSYKYTYIHTQMYSHTCTYKHKYSQNNIYCPIHTYSQNKISHPNVVYSENKIFYKYHVITIRYFIQCVHIHRTRLIIPNVMCSDNKTCYLNVVFCPIPMLTEKQVMRRLRHGHETGSIPLPSALSPQP